MIVLHVFTEEPSLKNVFNALLPKVLPMDVSFRVYSHQGKDDLMHALRTTLPSISRMPGSRVLITRDQDLCDCVELKAEIMAIVNETCACGFLIRIVCRELESWFLGDMPAIKQAYPRFPLEQYQQRAKFRNVDSIQVPNQELKKILPEFKLHKHLPKLEVSEAIARFMDVEKNTSTSFKHTIAGIRALVVG